MDLGFAPDLLSTGVCIYIVFFSIRAHGAWVSWPHSALQSTLNSFFYRVVSSGKLTDVAYLSRNFDQSYLNWQNERKGWLTCMLAVPVNCIVGRLWTGPISRTWVRALYDCVRRWFSPRVGLYHTSHLFTPTWGHAVYEQIVYVKKKDKIRTFKVRKIVSGMFKLWCEIWILDSSVANSIYCSAQWWNNFENRPTYGRPYVRDKWMSSGKLYCTTTERHWSGDTARF